MEPAKETWEKALGELQIQVSKSNYNTWLKNSRGIGYQEGSFVIGVPNDFVAAWLSQRLYPLVRKALANVTGADIDVRFVVDQEGRSEVVPTAQARQPDGGTSTRAKRHRFNPKYTFDNFVVGRCNRLAYAAAIEVAENPGTIYNPLFIHSGSGQGKTHLLHAIGHSTADSGLRVTYTSAEQFTSEFVSAVRRKQVDEFRGRYASVNVLLFDDIQFLFGKKQTVQCFQNTFNELHGNNRQIVISSDVHPREMAPLSSKLRSLFEWGLAVDIQPPDLETRMAILRAKAEAMASPETDEVLASIAQRTSGNVRQLEGALAYLSAQGKLSGATITTDIVNKLLTPPTQSKQTDQVLHIVADQFDVPPEEMTGKRKDRKTTLARQVAMYLMREENNCSLAAIGRELGGRNHATVIHGCEKIANELSVNPTLSQQVSHIRNKLISQRSSPGGAHDV